MEKYLLVIDVQNDFVTGALGSREAVTAAEAVVKKAAEFKGNIVFTKDTHGEDYADTQEGKNLPVAHCIKGTKGWDLIPELKKLQDEKQYMVFEKPTFGSVDLLNFLVEKYRKNELESVELVGLCTDICVISNALLIKAHMPELPVYVDASCCAGVTPEKHKAALLTMESCQIYQTL